MIFQNIFSISRLLLVSALCLSLSLSINAQINPSHQNFQLVPGETFSTVINSVEDINELPANGLDANILDGNLITNALGKNRYEIEFQVSTDYEGETFLDIEYFEKVGVRIIAKYTRLVFDVETSHISTQHDYKTIDVNSEGEEILVLDNDFTTHEPLTITNIAHQENGTATISDGILSFTPDSDFMGMAYVNYVVTNSLGKTAMGTASICVLDPNYVAAEGTINLTTKFDKSVPVLLPSESFSLDAIQGMEHGSIDILGADVFEYTPASNSTVRDEFTVTDAENGLTRTIIVNIIGDPYANTSVVDDQVFTAINHGIEFDVFANDFKKNSTIVSHSPELAYLGLGEFSYDPPEDFQGIKRFHYETYDGLNYSIGEILVYVNNYYPENKTKYQFKTKEETAFIINYQVPITGFGFQVLSQPKNGRLRALSDASSYQTECSQDAGYGLLIYEPNNSFTGVEEFDVKYCINEEQCRIIKIQMEVVPADEDCNCSGRSCIWAGDSNGDGKVSISDLLALGYHVGATGDVRGGTANSWSAEFANDWGETQVVNGLDIKHIDANGDGIITSSDVDAIDSNYDLYNNLVPAEILVIKDYPIDIIPSASSVDSGDWLSLDIVIGSQEFPVLDVHGIAYTLNLAPGLVDSSSIEVVDHSRVWLGNNSPILSMWKQPSDGRIDLGSTRTTGETVSGEGLTHTVGFIVEEEIEGLRRDRSNPIDILVENITFVDGSGNKFRLPDASITLELNGSENNTDDLLTDESVHVIPNPATDYIRLHANNKNAIYAVELYDMKGMRLHFQGGLDTNDYTISSDTLIEGLYIARVTTAKGTMVKKVKVVKD